MSWDKRCDNCIHRVPDWTNEQNSDHYCDNEDSDEYGQNTEYLFGCDAWEGGTGMRMIDADALSRVVKLAWDTSDSEDFEKSVFIAIATAPTIEERKKGKWIPVTKIYKVTEGQFPKTHIEWVDATEPDEIDGMRCSECGTVYDFIEARNWCSECGADMRGET